MGEYKFSMYARKQLGLLIGYDGQLFIHFLFLEIRFSFSKHAIGYSIFGYKK